MASLRKREHLAVTVWPKSPGILANGTSSKQATRIIVLLAGNSLTLLENRRIVAAKFSTDGIEVAVENILNGVMTAFGKDLSYFRGDRAD